MAETREEILAEFKIDKHGVIRSPGKFEGEMIYAPYFYMEVSDESIYHPDGTVDIYKPTEEDLKEFPELSDVYAFALWESDQGFVNLEHFDSPEALRKYTDRLEAEAEEEEEEE